MSPEARQVIAPTDCASIKANKTELVEHSDNEISIGDTPDLSDEPDPDETPALDVNNAASTFKQPSKKADAHPGDPRRMMSTRDKSKQSTTDKPKSERQVKTVSIDVSAATKPPVQPSFPRMNDSADDFIDHYWQVQRDHQDLDPSIVDECSWDDDSDSSVYQSASSGSESDF